MASHRPEPSGDESGGEGGLGLEEGVLGLEEGVLEDSVEEGGSGHGFYSLQVYCSCSPSPFPPLQIEETMEQLTLSSNPALTEHARLRLQIEGEEGGAGVGAGTLGGRLSFSPGGSQAMLVPQSLVSSTPREVGARPRTVGGREEEASPRSQGALTDRAQSPSQASVTSLLSGIR